jgi:multicomponent Na+:H+ antiporter subunit G
VAARLPVALLGALTAAAAAGQGVSGEETALRGNVVAEVMVLIGCLFLLLAAIGIFRFPDFYTRLHASTKLVTLGGIGIFGGSAIAFSAEGAAARVLLIAGFYLVTAPLSGYMIARAGYLRGLAPVRETTSVDEWGALGTGRTEFVEPVRATDDA